MIHLHGYWVFGLYIYNKDIIIKKCKKLKSSRHIQLTKKYLKVENLLAIPFDKGIGICMMKKETYENKMNTIINLPQFEKVEKKRKNAKHPVLKEEERIIDILQDLKKETVYRTPCTSA